MGFNNSKEVEILMPVTRTLHEEMKPEDIEIVMKYPDGLDFPRDQYKSYVLSKYSILSENDPDKETLKSKLEENSLNQKEKRSLACLMGLAVGDALGAPLEFQWLEYDNEILSDFAQSDVWEQPGKNKFRLKPGQWTDDTSMALCLADSLLVHQDFVPKDLRLRFLNWVQFGYNNSFALNEIQRGSVGLGGNISLSMGEFKRNQTEYTTAGDRNTSGNGSLMRLAPVPIYYHNDVNKAMEIAYKQSKTTHQGDEAAELCRLLTFLIVHAINYENENVDDVRNYIFDDVLLKFESELYPVKCLAKSQKEEKNETNENLDLNDRNWNWRENNFKYAVKRAEEMPGYIGSYSMDCLAMSLHCVYTTKNFKDAVVKAINLRGDSDTVGAVTAQLAGAIYGLNQIPSSWIDAVQQWDNHSILLRAYKLHHNLRV